MLLLRVPEVDDPDLLVELELQGVATLRFVGSADRTTAPKLEQLFDRVHAELEARRARQVIVDMRELDAMHSSCFKALCAWLGKVQDLDAAARYRIRVVTNGTIAWQHHALPALSCFDTALVTV